MLERPGEVLTREEIARELWPDGTFVDYEHGVNSAVNRIRDVLGDSAASPRFIETLARRGYRFVVPVERIAPQNELLTNAPQPLFPQDGTSATSTAGGAGLLAGGILASPRELPKASYRVVFTLFILLQLMYVGFYVGALANLAEVEELLSVLPRPGLILNVIIVTAGILIAVRAFVLSAFLFRAPSAGEKFLRIWPFLLALDELWSLSPYLLLHHINFGLALACTTLLAYSPFAQRSLVLMGAGQIDRELNTTARRS